MISEKILGIVSINDGWENYYINACKDLNVKFVVINLLADDWYNIIKEAKIDGLLIRPSGRNETMKHLFDERLFCIDKYLNIPMYPSYMGCLLYENKRMQHYFMDIYDIKHPQTWIFYEKIDAIKFFQRYSAYPLVSKPNLGGGAEGVIFLNHYKQAKHIANKVFTQLKFYNPGIRRWRKYKHLFKYPVMEDPQRNYLIIQEFIQAKWEWRIIKIGKSYFGHQKLSDGHHFSGSGKVGWVKPPNELLLQTKYISEKSGIRAINVDYFETQKNEYLVNEIQTIWGGKLDYQMLINGEPCRYVEKDGDFILEYGIFHKNKGCNLRVLDFLDVLNNINSTPGGGK